MTSEPKAASATATVTSLDVKETPVKAETVTTHPSPPATPQKKNLTETIKTIVILVIAAVVLCVVFAVSLGWEVPNPFKKATQEAQAKSTGPLKVELVRNPDNPKELTHTLMVPDDVRDTLRIRKNNVEQVAVAVRPVSYQSLELPGSTALNPSKIARIRVRFPSNGSEVVSIGTTEEGTLGQTSTRELRPGDTVKKGQELATFYSVDVGSKKNDLIDAICQLKLDQEIYRRAVDARGAVPEVFILNAERAVAADKNAINRAVKNLQTWNVPEADIQATRDEAEELSKLQKAGEGPRPVNPERERLWGLVTLRSPIDGVIIERNVSEKEIIVDNTVNVFQIADVSEILVLANAPEDQLPRLQALKEQGNLNWTVQTAGAPLRFRLTQKSVETLRAATVPADVLEKLKPLVNREFTTRREFEEEVAKVLTREEQSNYLMGVVRTSRSGVTGRVDEISSLIDQNTHTAVLKGYIKNVGGGGLRGGQYAVATIDLPPEKDVVEVPMAAIADDGRQTVVFVQPDPAKPVYTMRRVKVTHRFDKIAYVSSLLSDDDVANGQAQAKEQGLLPYSELKVGDRVITSGLLELKKELDDRESVIAASGK